MTMIVSYRGRSLTVSALFFILGLWNWPSWQAAASTNENDVNALKSLYAQWAGAYNNLPLNWVGDDPCGSNWAGVTCDMMTGTNVIGLVLTNFNITGGIPSTIANLTNLEILNLASNPYLGGPLPPELGLLTSLQQLIIMDAGLVGPIPEELGQLGNLTFLELNQNGLTGPIPPAMGNLQKLYWFDISENSLSGTLPVSSESNAVGLDSLIKTAHFHFNNNSLNGSIPSEIFSLPSLLHLLLDSNEFTGSIPSTSLTGTSLMILRLDNNKLSGPVPPELKGLTSLTELHLSNNLFNQTLPDLSALTKLGLLDVSGNQFEPQEIPAWVYSLTAGLTIAMDESNLIGNLDSSIFSLPKLQYLSLNNNSLNGTLSLGNISSSVQNVSLENNEFSILAIESIPTTLSPRLSGNPFCSVTAGVTYCKLVGNAPQSWTSTDTCSDSESCGEGQAFNPNVCSCASRLLLNLLLTSPSFSSINDNFVQTFRVEWAQKFTTILGTPIQANEVYIPSANFTNDGRMMFDLYVFPLSGASLNTTGVMDITSQLYYNAISLKEGPFLLRGYSPPNFPGKAKKSAIGLIVGIVVAIIVLAVIILLIAAYAIRQKKRADKAAISRPFASWGTTTAETGEAPQLKGARWFSLAELRKATNNFSDDNGIGDGGYGTVYRGELPGGGVVAVKKAKEGSVQGATEFKNEIELLSRVHHKNLVGLVGFCYEQNEQALVYEFMPNGTLSDHLLGHFSIPLSWDMRVAIALGSAKGLAYLHELANPPIIHRDVKSGNILLDEKMVAKVADFGLSKLAPEGADKGHLSTQVKGTLGYLDPEYYMTNQLSEKSDVYSFGVVLLEMLSARPPIEHNRYIVREVRNALNKGGIKALEPLLDPFLGEYPPKQMEAFLDLALLCVDEVAAGRPTMNEVVKKLEVMNGRSYPTFGKHITIEPQKADDIYGNEHLQKVKDPSFQYSGEPFTFSNVEPK